MLSIFSVLLNLWAREFCADSKIRFLKHVAHSFDLAFVDKLSKEANNYDENVVLFSTKSKFWFID